MINGEVRIRAMAVKITVTNINEIEVRTRSCARCTELLFQANSQASNVMTKQTESAPMTPAGIRQCENHHPRVLSSLHL